nr:MAG TPA: hypothetical protein [Caudoviricetes sp.]
MACLHTLKKYFCISIITCYYSLSEMCCAVRACKR